jgi:rRNA maturation endonuclease Nob1
MQERFEAQVMPDNSVISAHTVQQVCAACGYDLTAEELEADRCADCGAELQIKRSVSIEVTSVPAFGNVRI